MAFPEVFPILFGRYTGQGDPQFPLRFPIMFGMTSGSAPLAVTAGLEADGRTQINMEMQGDLQVTAALSAAVDYTAAGDAPLVIDTAGTGHVGWGVQVEGTFVTAQVDSDCNTQLLAQADLAVTAALEVAGGWAARGTPTVEVQFDADVRLDAVLESDPLALLLGRPAGIGWPADGNNEPTFPWTFPIMFGLSKHTADLVVGALAEVVSGWGIDPTLTVEAAATADMHLDALSDADLPVTAAPDVAGGWASRAIPTVEVTLDADVRLDALLDSDPTLVTTAFDQFQGYGLDTHVAVGASPAAGAASDQLAGAGATAVEAATSADLHPNRPADSDLQVTAGPSAAGSRGQALAGPLVLTAAAGADTRADLAGQADTQVTVTPEATIAAAFTTDLPVTAGRPANANSNQNISADLAVTSGGDTRGQYGVDTGTQVTVGLPAAMSARRPAAAALPVTATAAAAVRLGVAAQADLLAAVACGPIIGMAQTINAWSLNVEVGGLEVPLVRGALLDADMPVYVWRPNEPERATHAHAALEVVAGLDPVPSRGQEVAAEPIAVEVLAGVGAHTYFVYGSAFLPFFYAQAEGAQV